MQKVPIHLAEPGMVVAKPIVNDKGIQLVAEETVLTDSILSRLKKMQISFVMLKGSPVGDAGPDATAAEEIRLLNERFSHVSGDPLMERIRKSIERAITARGAEKNGEHA
jgi:hypothetical protein